MNAKKLVTVYVVVYHSNDPARAYSGPCGDGSFTLRTRDRAHATDFAKGRSYFGDPAKVTTDEVPASIAQRWGV